MSYFTYLIMKRQVTIDYKEFAEQARRFARKAEKLQEGWDLRQIDVGPNKGHVYLVKEQIRTLEKDSDVESSLEDLVGDISELNEPKDVATAEAAKNSTEHVSVHVEFHVLHSYSYLVPILYWNASFSNGKPLSRDEIWRLLKEVPADADKWGIVTQQEHPYLGRPFYYIHPCHTAEAMVGAEDTVASSDCREGGESWEYLTSWLTMFGRLVGLSLPLEFI